MESLFFKTILALNTATHAESVALLSHDKVIATKKWKSNKNESSKLLTSALSILKKTKLSFEDLDGILCVTGPGPFSAIRIGIATANALGFSMKKPVYAVTAETIWLLRKEWYMKRKKAKNVFVVASAGKGNLALIDFDSPSSLDARESISQHTILPHDQLIEEIERQSDATSPITILCDCTPSEKTLFAEKCPKPWNLYDETDTKEVLPFAKALLLIPPTLIFHAEANIVTPRYLRPPTITQAKKPLYVTP